MTPNRLTGPRIISQLTMINTSGWTFGISAAIKCLSSCREKSPVYSTCQSKPAIYSVKQNHLTNPTIQSAMMTRFIF